jgi:hypothetical protein
LRDDELLWLTYLTCFWIVEIGESFSFLSISTLPNLLLALKSAFFPMEDSVPNGIDALAFIEGSRPVRKLNPSILTNRFHSLISSE